MSAPGKLGEDGEGSPLTHTTFVQAAVSELVSSIQTTAVTTEYLRERYHSDEIAKNLSRVAENVRVGQSAGEAALDSRRALGADDRHYLFSGIHLIYTNPESEEYPLLPQRLQPGESREALAIGIAAGFNGYFKQQRRSISNESLSGAGLLSLLMDIPDIRSCILETLVLKGQLTQPKSEELNTMFSSVEMGTTYITDLNDTPEGRIVLRYMMETVIYLLDAGSTPHAITDALISKDVFDNADRLEADTMRLLNAFLLLGPDPEKNWCSQGIAAKIAEGEAKLKMEKDEIKRKKAEAEGAAANAAAAAAEAEGAAANAAAAAAEAAAAEAQAMKAAAKEATAEAQAIEEVAKLAAAEAQAKEAMAKATAEEAQAMKAAANADTEKAQAITKAAKAATAEARAIEEVEKAAAAEAQAMKAMADAKAEDTKQQERRRAAKLEKERAEAEAAQQEANNLLLRAETERTKAEANEERNKLETAQSKEATAKAEAELAKATERLKAAELESKKAKADDAEANILFLKAETKRKEAVVLRDDLKSRLELKRAEVEKEDGKYFGRNKDLVEQLKMGVDELEEQLKDLEQSVGAAPYSPLKTPFVEGGHRGRMLLYDIGVSASAASASAAVSLDPMSICETDEVFSPISMEDVAEACLVAWRDMTISYPEGFPKPAQAWTRRPNALAAAKSKPFLAWNGDFLNEEWALEKGATDLLAFTQYLDAGLGASRVMDWADLDTKWKYGREDNKYVKHCLARGLCGGLGPHETPNADGSDLLSYDAPRANLPLTSSQSALEALSVRVKGQKARQMHEKILAETQIVSDSRLKDDAAMMAKVTYNDDPFHGTLKGAAPGEGSVPATEKTQEPARSVRWAPVWKDMAQSGSSSYEADFSIQSVAISKACVLEHMQTFIKSRIQLLESTKPPVPKITITTLKAVVAVLKLKQLQSLACVAATCSEADSMHLKVGTAKRSKLSHTTRATAKSTLASSSSEHLPVLNLEDPNTLLITRPSVPCTDENGSTITVFPVDAGLAYFSRDAMEPAKASDPLEKMLFGTDFDMFDGQTSGCGNEQGSVVYHRLPFLEVTSTLRVGIQGADITSMSIDDAKGIIQVLERQEDRSTLDLFIGTSALATPYEKRGVRTRRAWGGFTNINPDLLDVHFMKACFTGSIAALNDLERIDHESRLFAQIKNSNSKARQHIFGLQNDPETASRDRRSGMWQNALREISQSSDRMLVFIRNLSGGLNEDSLSSLIIGEDPELQRTSMELAKRRQDVLRQSMSFQVQLTQGVLGAMFKASNLGVDVAESKNASSSIGDKIVVRSTEAKKEIQTALQGKPFFEANVSLQNMLSKSEEDLTLKQVIGTLNEVGNEFHSHLMNESVNNSDLGSKLSRETLSLPRNSYMVRLSDMACAAINDAFQELTRRLRQHDHMIRHVYLWECVEGPNTELSTQFNKLVRAQIQQTRANDTTSSIYVNNQTKMSINFKLEVEMRKMIDVVCTHIMRHSTPQFHIKDLTNLYAVVSPIAPGGGDGGVGGGGDDNDGPAFRAPPFNPESLRKVWTFRTQQRNARNDLANANPSDPSKGVVPLGTINNEGAPRMTDESFFELLMWFGLELQSLGLPVAMQILSVAVQRAKSRDTEPTDAQNVELSKRYDMYTPEAIYFKQTDPSEKHVILEAAKQWKERNNNNSMIERQGLRQRPSRRPRTTVIRDKRYYEFEFDTSKLPERLQNNDALISKSLNMLFEMLGSADASTYGILDRDEQKNLDWKPASVENKRMWYRVVNDAADESYRKSLSYYQKYFKLIADWRQSRWYKTSFAVKMVIIITALFGFEVLYSYNTGAEGLTLPRAFYGVVQGFISGCGSGLQSGTEYASATDVGRKLQGVIKWLVSFFQGEPSPGVGWGEATEALWNESAATSARMGNSSVVPLLPSDQTCTDGLDTPFGPEMTARIGEAVYTFATSTTGLLSGQLEGATGFVMRANAEQWNREMEALQMNSGRSL